MGYLCGACDQISDLCHQQLLRKMWRKMCIYKCMLNVYKNQQNRQTGSRNLMGAKTLPTIWGTYMKLVTKYQISGINSCWDKCDKKWAYVFKVYKNQLSRQTGSRNLTGPKTLPKIWYTNMKLVNKNLISAINSCWEKCDEKYRGRTEGRTDKRTEVKQYTLLLRGAGVWKQNKTQHGKQKRWATRTPHKTRVIIIYFLSSDLTATNYLWNLVYSHQCTVRSLQFLGIF